MVEFSNVSIRSDFGDYLDTPEFQKEEIQRLDEVRKTHLVDLRMMGTGNLYSDNNDLLVVGGVYNLSQALTHRLMTDRGSHPMDSAFGVPWSSYLGHTYVDRDLIRSELTYEVLQEISKESRIESVEEITVEFSDINAVRIDITVVPIGSSDSFRIGMDIRGR